MKRLNACAAAAAALCLTLGALWAAPRASADEPEASAPLAIGATVEDFKLPDAAGKEHSLSLLKGAKGTVVIFVSTACPVSNAYNERMQRLAADYRAKGVSVVGVNSNATESAEDVRGHAAEHKLAFTILKDKDNRVADRLGARVTPEAFFFDPAGKLLYRGRIDNADPRRGQPVTSDDLRNAIDETLAGKPVSKPEGSAFGCSIKRAG